MLVLSGSPVALRAGIDVQGVARDLLAADDLDAVLDGKVGGTVDSGNGEGGVLVEHVDGRSTTELRREEEARAEGG